MSHNIGLQMYHFMFCVHFDVRLSVCCIIEGTDDDQVDVTSDEERDIIRDIKNEITQQLREEMKSELAAYQAPRPVSLPRKRADDLSHVEPSLREAILKMRKLDQILDRKTKKEREVKKDRIMLQRRFVVVSFVVRLF